MAWLDPQALLALQQQLPGLWPDLVQLFLEDHVGHMEQLATLLPGGEPRQVTFHAHTLKGMSLGIGAVPLGELARMIEMDPASLPGVLPQLQHAVQQTLDAIQQRLAAMAQEGGRD